MRFIVLLILAVSMTLAGCTAYQVTDGAYVDNKVYLIALKSGGGPAEFLVTRCTSDENANLTCKRVAVNTK